MMNKASTTQFCPTCWHGMKFDQYYETPSYDSNGHHTGNVYQEFWYCRNCNARHDVARPIIKNIDKVMEKIDGKGKG